MAEWGQGLAAALARLSPEGRLAASPVELIGGGQERTFALRTENGQLPGIPRRDVFHVVYDGVRNLAQWAAEAAARFRAPMPRGPQKDFPVQALAGWLADVWGKYTGRSLAPNNRHDYRSDWPFLEFVKSVGRTVDPDFDGYSAVRRTYEARRERGRR